MAVDAMQIANALGRDTPDSNTIIQWSEWISDAIYLIGRRYDIALLDATDVDYVVKTSVVEHVRAWQPVVATQTSVTVDDGTVARTYTRDAGPLAIPDEMWALLGDDGPAAAFSITPYSTPDPAGDEAWS